MTKTQKQKTEKGYFVPTPTCVILTFLVSLSTSNVNMLLQHSPVLASVLVQNSYAMSTLHLACLQPNVQILTALLNTVRFQICIKSNILKETCRDHYQSVVQFLLLKHGSRGHEKS